MEKSTQSDTERGKVADGAVESDEKATDQWSEGVEARFVQRCEVDLCLDRRTSSQALHIFKDIKPLLQEDTIGTGSVEETERLWSACVLFAVKRLENGASAGDDKLEDNLAGFTLSQILKATKLRPMAFFKELPQVLLRAGPKLKSMYGDDWEKRLMVKEAQADFYYLTVLFNYYRQVYQNLFLSGAGRPHGTFSGLASGTNGGSGPSLHMRFGWMLFLVLRMRVLGQFVDLLTYINGLLAVVILLIIHMPPSLRKFSLQDECFFKERRADGQVKIIASLCALYHDASEEDVSNMVDKVSSMIGKLFRKSSGFRTRSCLEQLAGIDTEGLSYFEGLMDERSITANLRSVEKDYEDTYQTRGELDERMFINGEEHLTGTLANGSPTISGIKRKRDTLLSPNHAAKLSARSCPSPPRSPFLSPAKPNSGVTNIKIPPPTPVTVTMSTLKWLRTIISPLASQPSPELQDFFQACDYDISGEVTYRAQVWFGEIFPIDGARTNQDRRGTTLLDSAWGEQRRQEATKLYYRVLGAMCRAESQWLYNNNLTALLTNERFHQCMIACSAELVLYTHRTVTMTFPAVLEPTGITAFDLIKVIESFVRHEETLPRELKRHLNSVEQQILESMAWEKGSSMYNSLIVAKRHLAPAITQLGLLADPMPASDRITQHLLKLSGNVHCEPDGASVEGSGYLALPLNVASVSSVIRNGTPTPINKVGDQMGSLLCPLKERPSASTSQTKGPQPPLLLSVFASPQKPSTVGGSERSAETVISIFFLKVLKLAAVRLKDLCERLQQSTQVWEQVNRTMQHLLYEETSLFFNRHIDQLILCTIYGVCKVNKANVTFKKCIEHYGKQPQCKRDVFCNVLLDISPVKDEENLKCQETGDIIKFYNQVFVPATKQYLVHLGEAVSTPSLTPTRPGDEDKNEKDGCGQRSPRPLFPALPDISPKKVSASHNVFVSPLRKTEIDTIMSPHTRRLCACVGESTQDYQSPSKDLTAINNRLNNRLPGRQLFKTGSLVSDSLVAGSLCPCIKSANHHSVRLTTDSVLHGQSTPSWIMMAPLPRSPMKRLGVDREQFFSECFPKS